MDLEQAAAAREDHATFDRPGDPCTDVARCTWCSSAIYDDQDTVGPDNHEFDGTFHAPCLGQARAEEYLREFLSDVGRDCSAAIAEYHASHPTRYREHCGGALLSRIEAIITLVDQGVAR